MTLLVFLPLVAVVALVNRPRRRLRAYRQANQEAIGDVTGLLGELFGAALAVKVAGAEARVVEHLRAINERRRVASLRDARLQPASSTASRTTRPTSAPACCCSPAPRRCAAAASRSATSRSSSPTSPGWRRRSSLVGEFLTKQRQTGVSLERLQALMQGAPPERLVAPRAAPPPPRAAAAARAGPPPRPTGSSGSRSRGLTYRYPEQRPRRRGVDLTLRAAASRS